MRPQNGRTALRRKQTPNSNARPVLLACAHLLMTRRPRRPRWRTLFVQVNVPLTVVPAAAVGGKLAVVVMSAESTIVSCTYVGAPAGR